jgi:ATP-binding cassette subfamily B protein
MLAVIALDAVFRWIRQFLIIHLTARVDVKLNTYIFDKLIGLPIDFFERNQIGAIMTVYYYHQRILAFLTGQLLGSLLDSTVLLFFLPVMFFLSPLVTTFVLVICAVVVAWLVFTLPIYRRMARGPAVRARLISLSNARRHSHRQGIDVGAAPAPSL